MSETIKICSQHQEYKVPLIWTFAWNGAEYWCPYCGRHEGMMGAGTDVDKTDELQQRAEKYAEFTKDYIHACAMDTCIKTKFKGEMISPADLPTEEKLKNQKIKDKWELGVKVEEAGFEGIL